MVMVVGGSMVMMVVVRGLGGSILRKTGMSPIERCRTCWKRYLFVGLMVMMVMTGKLAKYLYWIVSILTDGHVRDGDGGGQDACACCVCYRGRPKACHDHPYSRCQTQPPHLSPSLVFCRFASSLAGDGGAH